MSEAITSFPLKWPVGKTRSTWRSRKHSAFKTTFNTARHQLQHEVHLLGGRNLVISTNIPLRVDGFPYSNAKPVDNDSGVAVYFDRKGRRLCFACDVYHTTHDNMRAITLTVGALRGIARWGTGDMMESAFSGFAALPEKGNKMPWWDVLRTKHDADEATIDAAFKLLAKVSHPDVGGSAERFHELTEAKEQGLAVARGRVA